MNRFPSRPPLPQNLSQPSQPHSRSSTPDLLDSSYSLSSHAASFVHLSPQAHQDDEEEDDSQVTLNPPIRPSDYRSPDPASPPSRSPVISPSPPIQPIDAPNLAIVGLSSLQDNVTSNTASIAFSSTHSPPLDSSSSIIECHGSPRSLSSWHPSDLPSHPGSSYGGGSQFGDREPYDPEHEHEHGLEEGPIGRGPPTDSEASDEDGQRRRRTQGSSRELFTAITGHLVMPRLSMTASASSRSPSVRSHSSASLHRMPEGRDRLRFSSHPRPIPNGTRTRVLVVGEAQAAHGLGNLDASLAPFVDQVERASELVAEFKITDPSTHHVLLDHVSGPFIRLQNLLDDGVFEKHTTTPTGLADLGRLVDGWVEREAYVVAFVEMDGFPAAPETLDFILALSRLVPTVPFIPTSLGCSSASDAYAIYTRQLVAKRVRHLGVPRPDHPFAFPDRDECVRRTRRCCLDWLAVEAAARAATVPEPGPREDAEPDRWSEKVHARREALRGAGSTLFPRTLSKRVPERPYSRDPLGMPSLRCVAQIGVRVVGRVVGRLVDRVIGGGPGGGGERKVKKNVKRVEWSDEPEGLSSGWVVFGVAATAATVLTIWGYRSLGDYYHYYE